MEGRGNLADVQKSDNDYSTSQMDVSPNLAHTPFTALFELNATGSSVPVQNETGQVLEGGSRDQEQGSRIASVGEDLCDSSSGTGTRWCRAETLRLIELYQEYQKFFEDKQYKKKTVWTMLAAKLAKSKVKYTGMQLCSRWKNLTKTYRDSLAAMTRAGQGEGFSLCQYFHELKAVFGSKTPAAHPDIKPAASVGRPRHCKPKPPQRQAKKLARPEHDAGSFVAIAPKLPTLGLLPSPSVAAHNGKGSGSHQSVSSTKGCDSHQSVSSTSGAPSAPNAGAGTFADVVRAVQDLHEDQRKWDERKLEALERMHKEKMQLFAHLFNVLLDPTQKNILR